MGTNVPEKMGLTSKRFLQELFTMVNDFYKETLLSVVAEWLEEEGLPSLVPREQPVHGLEALHHILAIVGPRRAGKTYFMYQLISSLLSSGRFSKKDILFVDFEDYRLAGFAGSHMDELLASFYQLAGRYPSFLFFDEVQNISDWNRVLRTLHNRGRFRIVVSGSNSRLLGHEIATELRGRYQDLLMLPFSFREYLRSRKVSFTPASIHTGARGGILAAFTDYIRHGGFPEIVLSSTESQRRKLLQSYYKTIFYRDILERYNIKARYILDALMNDFLETYAGVFSITRFERHLKNHGLPGSKRTIANYLHYLKEAFFIIANEKFSFSPRKRALNPKKTYLIDTGFASLGHPFTESRGRILENVVAVELFRRELEVYYFKDKYECDFIVKHGTRPACALQVCWKLTERNMRREIGGIAEACRALNLHRGFILTYDQEGLEQTKGVPISIVPVWKWLIMDNIQELSRRDHD